MCIGSKLASDGNPVVNVKPLGVLRYTYVEDAEDRRPGEEGGACALAVGASPAWRALGGVRLRARGRRTPPAWRHLLLMLIR